ncbi:tetratricopeptide repeat protein [Luteimonas sp. SJ-92]|uniref:Tetratricopeptide repeat protein n=1 Tax=Luteimonas salinisoli TaxID=2752307 RepID=A0A853JGV3_9GAMM|nr:tetratricopeptide repeat protein [Luteimonas salinisoli]NZA27690.1 tetratricopeptide repeat protein [Luteimonas salinisoli]
MESFALLLSQLVAIKWLLIAIALGVLGMLVIFFVIAVNLLGAVKEGRSINRSNNRRSELDEMLASGESKAAKFTALEWVTAQPLSPEAHWALAKAHYQLGELSEAKQVLKGMLKFAPEEHYRVDAWLELLDSKFSERRPKPVS